MTKRRICLGAFAGAHGVKGEARVKTFTETEDGVARYGAVESEDGARRFTLKFIRVLKPGVALVAAREIESREDAQALAGVRLYVDRSALPPAGPDEYYLEDLIELAVADDEGRPLGRVVAVHNFGAGDLLEFEAPGGARRIVPFSKATVPVVDLAKGITIAAAALAEVETGESEKEDGG